MMVWLSQLPPTTVWSHLFLVYNTSITDSKTDDTWHSLGYKNVEFVWRNVYLPVLKNNFL